MPLAAESLNANRKDMKSVTLFTALALVAAVRLPAQDPSAATQPKQNPPSSQVSTQVFVFDGGSFYDFVGALRKTYGTNALALFESPRESQSFSVPRMRVPGPTGEFRSVLYLYNKTSEAGDWYLGKWVYLPINQYEYQNSDNSLRTLSFLPPKLATPGGGSGIAVKAFSIGNLSPDEQKSLREIVEKESSRLREYIEIGRYGRQDPSEATGRISLHEGSGLLVATGGKTYVELVASVVEAFEKRRHSLSERLQNRGQ